MAMTPGARCSDDGAFERELFASIQLSPIATVVTDPRLPDNPVVAVNDAFCALTGYRGDEVIGRNCRFLAGEANEDAGRHALRAAVREARASISQVRNFRKDGTPFDNLVMVAPVFLADGTLGYFIGSQMEAGDAPAGPDRRRVEAGRKLGTLTPRQRDVLVGMLAGKLNKQIAADLRIDETTVKMHRAALLRKLGVRASAEAIRIGVEAGLV